MPRLTTNETSQQPVNVEASAMNEESVSNDIPQLNNERMPQEPAIHETNNVYIGRPATPKIENTKVPVVVFVGPPSSGKSMILVRLAKFLRNEGYTIKTDPTFLNTKKYQEDCQKFNDKLNTNIALDVIENLTPSNLSISDGKYQIMDIAKKIDILTDVDANEIDMMWNYQFDVKEGDLTVIARKVVIVPQEDDSNKKQYGDPDPENNPIKFTTKHYVDGEVINELEAILDYTDFVGALTRAKGEKPGLYEIINYNLAPAVKGDDGGYNFEIIDIDGKKWYH